MYYGDCTSSFAVVIGYFFGWGVHDVGNDNGDSKGFDSIGI
jgi:hypothetical protein